VRYISGETQGDQQKMLLMNMKPYENEVRIGGKVKSLSLMQDICNLQLGIRLDATIFVEWLPVHVATVLSTMIIEQEHIIVDMSTQPSTTIRSESILDIISACFMSFMQVSNKVWNVTDELVPTGATKHMRSIVDFS